MSAKPEPKKWSALECCYSPDGVSQGADQTNEMTQQSNETIVIKDSCDVNVSTTDTQVAVSLQAALQVAIAIVISISIADSDLADQITQDLLQKSDIKQANTQHLWIENSKGVNVTTTDTDVAASIQVLLQILVALIAQLDIL